MEMCFDIDVSKLSLEELGDALRRILLLLSSPGVMNSLPDLGRQLRQVRDKLEKEIELRELLQATHKKIQKLSLKCASEANIVATHTSKLCSMEKNRQRERFKPHYTLKPQPTKTQSMKELHSGTKLIDLTTSLSLQKQQEERVKAEQVRAKQEKLMLLLSKNNDNTEDSDSEGTPPGFDLNDFLSDVEETLQAEGDFSDDNESTKSAKKMIREVIFAAESRVRELRTDQPGPSSLQMNSKSPTKKIQAPTNTYVVKTDSEESTDINGKSEKEIQPKSDIDEVQIDNMEQDQEPEKLDEEMQPAAEVAEEDLEQEKKRKKLDKDFQQVTEATMEDVEQQMEPEKADKKAQPTTGTAEEGEPKEVKDKPTEPNDDGDIV